MTTTAAVILATAIFSAGPASAPADGPGGILGAPGEKPDHADRPEHEGAGPPAGAKPPPGPPAAGAGLNPHAGLDERIARLNKRIAEMEKVTRETVRPVDALAEAEERVRRLEKAMDKARGELAAADREEAARLARRKLAFDEKWKQHADAIEKRARPAETPPLQWAELCDEYCWERADLEADFAAVRRRIRRDADRRVTPLTLAVDQARQHVERIRKGRKDVPPEAVRLTDRTAGWRAHKAELLAEKNRLAELGKLQVDLKGSSKSRKDLIETEAVEQSGFMLTDALGRLVLREFALSDATRFPSRADLDGGLSLPEWAKVFDALTRRRARLAYAVEQVRLADKALRGLAEATKADDEAKLRFAREMGFGEDAVRAEAERSDKSRPRRIADRKAELTGRLEYWTAQAAAESAELKRMEKPTTRPATAPAGDGG